MPLVFNGVTIPNDVANALSLNGVDITKVNFNGVDVWVQSIFSATWSGDFTVPSKLGGTVSGSLFRYSSRYSGFEDDGAWISVNSNGEFQNARTFIDFIGTLIGFDSGGNGVSTALNKLAMYRTTTVTGEVDFDVQNGFTGYSNSANNNLETSGGLLSYYMPDDGRSDWVSLT